MNIKYIGIGLILFMVGLSSCSKRVHPDAATTSSSSSTSTTPTASTVVSNDATAAKKATVKNKPAAAPPKVISVNDLSATKTVDGRYFYDLQGHRYWKNNKDGKYYLFNKAMYANAAFKPQ
jgi:hypothetical protein